MKAPAPGDMVATPHGCGSWWFLVLWTGETHPRTGLPLVRSIRPTAKAQRRRKPDDPPPAYDGQPMTVTSWAWPDDVPDSIPVVGLDEPETEEAEA